MFVAAARSRPLTPAELAELEAMTRGPPTTEEVIDDVSRRFRAAVAEIMADARSTKRRPPMATTMRAKFKVHSHTTTLGWNPHTSKNDVPIGTIELSTVNKAALDALPLGAEVYVDFTPVEPEAAG
jgi:hypothetical protein